MKKLTFATKSNKICIVRIALVPISYNVLKRKSTKTEMNFKKYMIQISMSSST